MEEDGLEYLFKDSAKQLEGGVETGKKMEEQQTFSSFEVDKPSGNKLKYPRRINFV